MKFALFFVLAISVSFAYAQSQDIIPSGRDYVPYTENYNVRFDSDGNIDYDLLIAKIMPEIFEKKFRQLGVNITSQDIVLNRGPQIAMYQPQSYNCGYAIDNEKVKVYWLETAINSTHIQYAEIYEKIPRDDVFHLSYTDCFSPLEIEVAEIFLQEKSYLSPDEELRIAASIKHEIRGNENLNKYQFKIGKFNLDYKEQDVLPFCGKFEGKMAGSGYFTGILKDSGEMSFGLEKSLSPLCAISTDAILYDANFRENQNRDESLQQWKNIRQETVYLKAKSAEKILQRNYIHTEFIHNMIFAFSSHQKLDYVDYQPENSSTVLKFTPIKKDSYMKIRLPDNGVHYYMTYGDKEWHEGKLLGITILVDEHKTSYTQFSHIESPDAPYPQYFTDIVFQVPANSTDVKLHLEIEDYKLNEEFDFEEWQDY